MKRVVTCAVAALLMVGPWWTGPVSARDQGELGVVSPAEPEVEHEFPAIPGLYPLQPDVAHPFAAYRPTACREAPYCDAMEVTVDLPEGYREFYAVQITVDWPEGPAGNQLTLHVWPDDDPISGAPLGPCDSPRDESCLDGQPISITLVEPAPGEPVYVTVVNAEGLNGGYTVQITFLELDLDLPDFEDPALDFVAAPTPRPESLEQPRLADLFANPEAVENPDRPRILVPGPDGDLTELDLPILAAGQREPDTGRTVNPFVTAGIVTPLLAAFGAFLVVRRRHAD